MASRTPEDMEWAVQSAREKKKSVLEFPYDDELADDICDAISNSAYGLQRICKENKNFPCANTIHKWVRVKPEFAEKYYAARKEQTNAYVADMMERSYDESRDMYMDGGGHDKPNPTAITRDKLISDNIKWLAAKLNRNIYGEKTTIETKDLTHEAGLDDLDKE